MAIMYHSNYDLTIPFSDVCAQVALTANVQETFTVPGGATNVYSARFTYTSTSNVFVRLNATPAIPAGATVGAEPYSEFRAGCDGSQRYVKGGDVIHFISPDAATTYVGIRLMSVMAPG